MKIEKTEIWITCRETLTPTTDTFVDGATVRGKIKIEKNGGNPFYEYSLPKAILKFKQGTGRLIRSKTDTGRVIICDERIKTNAYGKRFLESVLQDKKGV